MLTAPQLPLPIPVPLAFGVPAEGYPWNWSVYRWLDGSWQQTAGLAGEGCDEGESVCALTNAGAIEGGAWAPAEIPAGRFVCITGVSGSMGQ